jgi:hypothetical protein
LARLEIDDRIGRNAWATLSPGERFFASGLQRLLTDPLQTTGCLGVCPLLCTAHCVLCYSRLLSTSGVSACSHCASFVNCPLTSSTPNATSSAPAIRSTHAM